MLTWFPAEFHGLLLAQLFYIKAILYQEGPRTFRVCQSAIPLEYLFFFKIKLN